MLRALTILGLVALLAGCTRAAPAPAAAGMPRPTAPIVGALLADTPSGTVSVRGVLLLTAAGAMLADSLAIGPGGELVPADQGQAIWLVDPPDLPADAELVELSGARYGPADVRGAIEGPGSFGPGGAYSYQLVAQELRPLGIRTIDIPLLLSNSDLYEGQALRLSGQILVSPSSALLVERIGAGGVPTADSLQVKLSSPPAHPDALDWLSSSGAVSYGPASILGIWRAGSLHPLLIQPG